MKKRTIAMLAALGALAALVAVYAYLQLRPAPAAPVYEEGARNELSKLDTAKLVKIVLSGRPEGTLTLLKKDGAWAVDQAFSVKLDESAVDDLVYSFTALFAERTIEEKPTDLAQYGLAPPRAVARGYLEDGTVKTILLGDATPAGNTYYLQVQGDPAVYTVWMNHGAHFHWKVADLRSKSLLAVINPDEVVYYKAVLRSGQVLEAIEKTPGEAKQFQLGFGKFLLTKPYPAPRGVDGEKFDATMRGPMSVDITEFVDDAPKSLAAYGLERPWGEVLVRDKANTLHLLFGADRGADRVCFKIAGQPAVYAVDAYKLDFMKVKPFDIVDKFIFIPSIEDLDRLDISAAGRTHVFTLARTTKKATEADAEDEVLTTYTGDGKDLNEDYFKKFYQAVIGLSAEGEVSRPVPDNPVISIRYRLNKGDRLDVTIDLAPYDKIFYASFVDGVGGFALTKVQTDGLLAKMEKLLKGEEVTD